MFTGRKFSSVTLKNRSTPEESGQNESPADSADKEVKLGKDTMACLVLKVKNVSM